MCVTRRFFEAFEKTLLLAWRTLVMWRTSYPKIQLEKICTRNHFCQSTGFSHHLHYIRNFYLASLDAHFIFYFTLFLVTHIPNLRSIRTPEAYTVLTGRSNCQKGFLAAERAPQWIVWEMFKRMLSTPKIKHKTFYRAR